MRWDTLYLSNNPDSWDLWSARHGRARSTLHHSNDAKQLHSVLGCVLVLYLVEGKRTCLLASIIYKLNCLLISQKKSKMRKKIRLLNPVKNQMDTKPKP